jgi:cellulose synthase/poly-beta-1,6-N-acetylglucosamine synthase-like glycosyltransferase
VIVLPIVFWLAVLVILQTYVGYPVGIYLKSKGRKEDELGKEVPAAELPSISVLIPAYNEERWIARKIENVLALEYPRDRLQILVATDGCTDQTVAIAEQYVDHGVEIRHHSYRSGKSALLNRVVPTVRGEIVLVTDVTALLPSETLRLLARQFHDPKVGCVTGPRVCLYTDSAASEGEGLYWRYEAWIKRSESRLGTCLGANGQVLAVRKSLFPHIPEINDDFYVAMKVLVFDRGKVLFEPRAKALIPAAANFGQELERKIRTNEGFLRDVSYLLPALNPWKSPVWWRFFSHHVLRRLVPFAMILALAASLLLWRESSFYRVVSLAQLVFYAGATAGFLLERQHVRFRILYLPFYFSFANAAVLLAWVRWVRGKQQVTWQRTERIAPRAHPASSKQGSGKPV